MTDEQILQAMKSMLEPMQKEFQEFRADLSEVKQEARKTSIILENEVKPNIQLLLEAQQDINTKFQKLDRMENTLNSAKIES